MDFRSVFIDISQIFRDGQSPFLISFTFADSFILYMTIAEYYDDDDLQ